MNQQQAIELINEGKKLHFNSGYFPVGYDHQVKKLYILAKNNNHVHYLTDNDVKLLKVV